MVVSIDEMVLAPRGPRSTLGNRIVFQVRRPTIEQQAGADWVRASFIEFCGALAPAWASARHPGEYWAKVMSERPSIQAVGRDFARYLPGLFWLNCLARRYGGLAEERALLTTPATEVVTTAGGVVIVRGDDPRAWASSALAMGGRSSIILEPICSGTLSNAARTDDRRPCVDPPDPSGEPSSSAHRFSSRPSTTADRMATI